MKLSLTLLGLAMACLAGVKADDSTSTLTADERIMLAVASTNQTGGPSPYDWPDAAPAAPEVATNTSDTTVDVVSSRSEGESSKRSYKSAYNLGNIITKRHDYVTLTDGTDPRYQNAALQAPSYLTYKVISNTTSYATAKKACLAYCSSVSKCVAANMYNEIGNPLLDHTFSEKSNRKCALYGDVPTLSQMTNKGGQQLYGPNSPANCIENSAVFYLGAAAAPTTPSGYTFTFGPLDAATSASLAVGYMGYDFITQYDPDQCAKLCDARKADPVGGKCKFFNIWRGVVSGKPTTYTCSYFYQATDASTATNTGDAVNKVTVTFSRGYTRNST